MKRLITTFGAVAVATAAFAQGTVEIFNLAQSRFFTDNFGTIARTPASTTQFYYWEVLTAPSTVTSVDASLQQLLAGPWSDTGASATNTGATGLMSGSTAAPNTGAFVNNWAPGVTNSFIVVGWSSDVGATWAQAAAGLAGSQFIQMGTNGIWLGANLPFGGFIGATAIGQAVAQQPTMPAPLLFGSVNTAQVTPISGSTLLFITNIPEPSAVALAGLGVASLVIFRRQVGNRGIREIRGTIMRR